MLKRIWDLYYSGFKNMPQWGKTLWLIVFIKLVIIFFVFKFLLMPNYLTKNFKDSKAKSEHVLEILTNKQQ